MKRFNFIFASLVLLIHSSEAANILFFFTGGTYSHDISIWPLAVRLAERNHSVTFYSAHPQKPWKDERIRVLNPPKIEEINSRYLGDTLKMRLEYQEQALWDSIAPWSYEVCEYILTNPEKPETRELFYGQKFDLVIVDSALCDCGHIVGYYHQAKVIGSDSTSILPWFYYIYGFPTESSWIPSIATFFQYPMNILNVIQNYFEPLYWTYIRRTTFYPKLETLMKQLLKKNDVPSFVEVERRASLLFVNTHTSVELPQSLPPNFVQIGGMQMWGQRNATIPSNIKNFIEKAEAGVIPLAFGSSVDFSFLPSSIEAAFFEAFRRFPKINFIVKASSEKPSHCPQNLQFVKWMPQKEILAHPKTLACITHGGLNGILEATWNGIPLITLPIFAEQDFQSYKLQAREVGIRLEIRDLTADQLASAISDIITDPKYKNNMKAMQAAFRDRPQTSLDLATYWTEYVLRHDNLSFMSPMTYQPGRVYLEEFCFLLYSWMTTLLIAVFIGLAISARCLKSLLL